MLPPKRREDYCQSLNACQNVSRNRIFFVSGDTEVRLVAHNFACSKRHAPHLPKSLTKRPAGMRDSLEIPASTKPPASDGLAVTTHVHTTGPHKKQRSDQDPFIILENRAMISLGPFSEQQYCQFACPFCYVNSAYLSYADWKVPDIIDWLVRGRESYDIVYISGDTDSFAGGPARRESAIQLVEAIGDLEVEIMITTRALISDEHIKRLAAVASKLRSKGLFFFGCVSISQWQQRDGYPNLEPPPIPSVVSRIEQLGKFKANGLVSVLAMRPFLPGVPTNDYCQIVDHCQHNVDIVLGKEWFADGDGAMDRPVMGDHAGEYQIKFDGAKIRMPFDDNNALWKVYNPKDVVAAVQAKCDELDLPFFMTSRPAVDWMRMRRRNTPKVIGIGALNVNFFASSEKPNMSRSDDEIKAKREVWPVVSSKFWSKLRKILPSPISWGWRVSRD
jgi:hypothetical protein